MIYGLQSTCSAFLLDCLCLVYRDMFIAFIPRSVHIVANMPLFGCITTVTHICFTIFLTVAQDPQQYIQCGSQMPMISHMCYFHLKDKSGNDIPQNQDSN